VVQEDVDSEIGIVESASECNNAATAFAGRKRKAAPEPDFGSVLSRVTAHSALNATSLSPRQIPRKIAGRDMDDDWLFALRVYVKLGALPPSHDKESFKLRIEAELLQLTYGIPASGPAAAAQMPAVATPTTSYVSVAATAPSGVVFQSHPEPTDP